jgi:hypothetical protein
LPLIIKVNRPTNITEEERLERIQAFVDHFGPEFNCKFTARKKTEQELEDLKKFRDPQISRSQ